MCLINNTIRNQQVFVTNIEETACSTTTEDIRMIRPLLWTNAREIYVCGFTPYTPQANENLDTGIHHSGLTAMLQANSESDVIVQLSKSITDESKFLCLNALTEALSTDPDLAAIPAQLRPQCLQSLYICTGCDYVSFFKGIGKAIVSCQPSFF